MIPCSTGELPQIISGTIKDNASPESLFDLLHEITTPWIILPRAYRFLKKRECCYLPVYLKTIDRETDESCLKLFSRIAVEFMGNYTLKFADRCHPLDQLTKLLFYGYSALFWKTLRCPPENLENSAAFDNFFRWMCRLIGKSDFLGPEETTSLNRMIKMKSEYIKLFIGHLNSAYALIHPDVHQTQKNFLNRIFNNLQILLSK